VIYLARSCLVRRRREDQKRSDYHVRQERCKKHGNCPPPALKFKPHANAGEYPRHRDEKANDNLPAGDHRRLFVTKSRWVPEIGGRSLRNRSGIKGILGRFSNRYSRVSLRGPYGGKSGRHEIISADDRRVPLTRRLQARGSWPHRPQMGRDVGQPGSPGKSSFSLPGGRREAFSLTSRAKDAMRS